MSELIKNTLEPFYHLIGSVEYYEIPKTVRNPFLAKEIENCIAYIEVLRVGSEMIKDSLINAGFKVRWIGRDLYVIQKDMNEQKLKQLRSLVIMELDAIAQYEKPNVYAMYVNPATKEEIIKYVIDRVIGESRTISSAIVEIEREYNINLQND